MVEDLTNLVKKAKIQRNLSLLYKTHETIITTLEYLKSFKRSHRRSETWQLNDEIKHLENLNLLVFRVHGEIHRNITFRMENKKLKLKGG